LMPPRDAEAIILPDEQLMYRGNPYHRDHDAAGYRNATRPDRADIVVLGDSFAYGAGLKPWPKRLGDSLRRVVYNMALPRDRRARRPGRPPPPAPRHRRPRRRPHPPLRAPPPPRGAAAPAGGRAGAGGGRGGGGAGAAALARHRMLLNP